MVADARFRVTQPIRSVFATILYPVQWLILQPLHATRFIQEYIQSVESAQQSADDSRLKLIQQSQRAASVEQLKLENAHLRQLLELKQKFVQPISTFAEVLYDAPDPYTRRVIINKGLSHSLMLGSPVIDELGVVGQITRLHPFTSEVTLLIDRDHAIPVLNTRTGARSVAYGDPQTFGGTLELRFMATNADVLVGDLLTTSGVDGVYPAGLAIAKITKIERKADSPFAKIYCTPIANTTGTSQVAVLSPIEITPPNPLIDKPASEQALKRKGSK